MDVVKDIKVDKYVDVPQKASELGLNKPVGLCILPNNLEKASSIDELVHDQETDTIRKVLYENNIQETLLEPGNVVIPYRLLQSVDFTIPTIYVSMAMLLENKEIILVLGKILFNFLKDFFLGRLLESTKIKGSYVIKRGHIYQKISYEGRIQDLPKFTKHIQDMINE